MTSDTRTLGKAPGLDGIDRLARVSWIGGSTFSGKSTVSRILADRYDLDVYCCDDELPRHMQTATTEDQPTLELFASLIERPMLLLPTDLLAASIRAMAREQLTMVFEELLARPEPRPTVVEGAAVLPECLGPAMGEPGRAVWLLSSEQFMRSRYREARAELVSGTLAPYSDPERAFRHWMERDLIFAEAVRHQVQAQGLASIQVDGSRPPEDIADEVAERLCLERSAA